MGAVGQIKYLKSANSRWNMQSRELLERLGLKPSGPIPKDFEGKFKIDGVEITVTLPPVKGARKHRILAKCPDCGTLIPAGRLHQHTGTKVCEEIQKDPVKQAENKGWKIKAGTLQARGLWNAFRNEAKTDNDVTLWCTSEKEAAMEALRMS